MSKGFTVTRCSVISLPSLVLALLFAANLSMVCLAQAQIQTHRFQDEFLNRSRIDSASVNTQIDTAAGVITLFSNVAKITTTANFSVVLSGIDTTFKPPAALGGLSRVDLVDIDPVPGVDNVYLVAELATSRVFSYDAATGRSVLADLLAGVTSPVDPVDVFAYREGSGNTLKVLVTDSRKTDGAGRILKINADNLNVEWPPDLSVRPYSNPSDAVFLPNRQEVLICETGKDQLITVSLASNLSTWQFNGGADRFNKPVDVETDPQDPNVYLVTDRDNHRVVLVRRTDPSGGQIFFQFGRTGQPGADSTSLNLPMDADFVQDAVDPSRNGNILIADAGNSRLIEVNRSGRIVYTFARPLSGMTDADRLPNEQSLVAYQVEPTKILPKRLGYESNTAAPFISSLSLFDFTRFVDFDSLRWNGTLPSGTRIRLQLRSVNSPGEIVDDTRPAWLGPTGPNDFYEVNGATVPINQQLDGKRYIQFRAFLETNTRLLTPELRTVTISAHYFLSTPPGVITSTIIGDTTGNIITAWRSLEFTTTPPPLGTSVKVDILDADTNQLLESFPSSAQSFNKFDIDPTRVPGLRGKQALRLRATLETTNTAVTPRLLSWAVEWNYVPLRPSQTAFTNASFSPVSAYRFGGTAQDSAYISVVDPNVLPLRDSVTVNIRTGLTKDAETLILRVNPVTREAFRGRLPVIFNDTATLGNRRLEVRDRDTLRVEYTDPGDPTDKSRAMALIIRRARGEIFAENSAGVRITSIGIDDSLYVRVVGETDQDESPAQDSVLARVFNPRTSDSETITLFEVANGNTFNTGTFLSRRGLHIFRGGVISGDGRLTVNGGEDITARYEDPDSPGEAPLDRTVRIITPEDSVFIALSEAFDFTIAPNPYRSDRHQQLNLRAQVRNGSMALRQVEIYNLSGDRVRTILGSEIRLGTSGVITSSQGRVYAQGWWNLQGDDGAPVAAGTYFAKFYAQLMDQGRDEQVTTLRKMVIVQ